MPLMTNWENKGERKQDKVLVLASYFLLFTSFAVSSSPAGAGHEQLPRVQQLQTAPTTVEPKHVTVTTPCPGAWNRMHQQRGQKKLNVFWENQPLLRVLENLSSLLLDQVKNKFILLPITLQCTIQKHHLIVQTG